MRKIVFVACMALVPLSARGDFSISTKPTQNVNCSVGVCTATAKGANLSTSDLTALLAGGDVTVKTGGGALAIQVLDGFAWTNTSRLTLDAAVTVGIRDTVAVQGAGSVNIKTNDGGSGGDLDFFGSGKIDFDNPAASLSVNGKLYGLVNDIAGLASAVAASPSGNFALAQDYDATAIQYNNSPIATAFLGNFEGLGHTIANLHVEPESDLCQGMFSMLAATPKGRHGAARDIHLSHILINSNAFAGGGSAAGGLVGCNGGVVRGAFVDGQINGNGNGMNALGFGGLVGRSIYSDADRTYIGRVENSQSHANVSVTDFPLAPAGGLVGDASGSVTSDPNAPNILNSSASGNVTGYLAGGLAGVASTISLSSATGKVTASNGGGGLAGAAFAVGQSYATGSVNADSAGGLVGQGGVLVDSYATGASTCHGLAGGGLIGFVPYNNGPTVQTSYSVGQVTSANGCHGVGGSIGTVPGHTTVSSYAYWDLDTSGQANACAPKKNGNLPKPCALIIGLTDTKLKSALPAGFDPNIWAQSAAINNGYPYLLANPPQ